MTGGGLARPPLPGALRHGLAGSASTRTGVPHDETHCHQGVEQLLSSFELAGGEGGEPPSPPALAPAQRLATSGRRWSFDSNDVCDDAETNDVAPKLMHRLHRASRCKSES